MKIALINATSGIGSTGKICEGISSFLSSKDVDNIIYYSEMKSNYRLSVKYNNLFIRKISSLISHVFGIYGFEGKFATLKLIRKIKKFSPDIIHLHNVHSHSFDLKTFFKFARRKNLKVVWTFHDCWAFTGYCHHFVNFNCYKWKEICCSCPAYRESSFLLDNSKSIFLKKKYYISNCDLSIVCPSKWLASLVNESFLGDFNTTVINNGIDTKIFFPQQKDNSLLKKMGIDCNKKIILAVALNFTQKKGIDDIIKISSLCPSSFQVVMIGNVPANYNIPQCVKSISPIYDQNVLAKLISSADVFINPTYEDTFPTSNLEAVACGIPVVTYDVGGSSETIEGFYGYTIKKGDYLSMYRTIEKILSNEKKDNYNYDLLSEKNAYEKYYSLYNSLLK